MSDINSEDLDKYITGNYGEEQYLYEDNIINSSSVQDANSYDNRENWSKKCDEVNERRLGRALEGLEVD